MKCENICSLDYCFRCADAKQASLAQKVDVGKAISPENCRGSLWASFNNRLGGPPTSLPSLNVAKESLKRS